MEHRPQGPRPDDGQEGQGQDQVQGLRLPRLLAELRRAARPGDDPGAADRGRTSATRSSSTSATRSTTPVTIHPHGVFYSAGHGRRLQGQVHRPRRLRPEGRRRHLRLGGDRRAPRAPGSTTTTGRWTRCRVYKGLFGPLIIRDPGKPRPTGSSSSPSTPSSRRRPGSTSPSPASTAAPTPATRRPCKSNVGDDVAFHVYAIDNDFHTFHIHGHRWTDADRHGRSTT